MAYFFLHQVCNADEQDIIDPDGFLGVDFGIANIAVDSDGSVYQGKTGQKASLSPSPVASEASVQRYEVHASPPEKALWQGTEVRYLDKPQHQQEHCR